MNKHGFNNTKLLCLDDKGSSYMRKFHNIMVVAETICVGKRLDYTAASCFMVLPICLSVAYFYFILVIMHLAELGYWEAECLMGCGVVCLDLNFCYVGPL